MDFLASLKPDERKAWDSFDARLEQADIIELQKIDADCNDCRHFQRGAANKVGGLTVFKGTCKKTGAEVNAWPTQYSGHSCFEHRRSPE